MFMDLDTKAVFAPLTQWNAVVHDPRRLPELARRAFREALSGRPGPVHLDIPQDVLSAVTDYPDDEFDLAPSRYRATAGPRPAASTVEDAGCRLRPRRAPSASAPPARRGDVPCHARVPLRRWCATAACDHHRPPGLRSNCAASSTVDAEGRGPSVAR